MYIFLKKIILFTLSLIISYLLIIVLILTTNTNNYFFNLKSVKGGYGHSLLRFKEAKSYGKIDLLFIGSSHSYRSFDPSFFDKNNIKSFNLGSSRQTPINSYYLVKEYYNYLKPKKAIIEVFWGVFQNDGQESFIDIVSNSDISINHFLMLLKLPSLSSFNSFIYNSLQNIISENQIQKDIENDKYISGGYVENSLEINKSLNSLKKIKKSRLNKKQMNFQKKHLTLLITFLKQKKCEPILVLAPVPIEFKSSFQDYDVFINEITELSKKNKIKFLDFTNDLSKYDSEYDFYDINHLSNNGVKKFNTELITSFKHTIK